jgi:hypothetical protein
VEPLPLDQDLGADDQEGAMLALGSVDEGVGPDRPDAARAANP